MFWYDAINLLREDSGFFPFYLRQRFARECTYRDVTHVKTIEESVKNIFFEFSKLTLIELYYTHNLASITAAHSSKQGTDVTFKGKTIFWILNIITITNARYKYYSFFLTHTYIQRRQLILRKTMNFYTAIIFCTQKTR